MAYLCQREMWKSSAAGAIYKLESIPCTHTTVLTQGLHMEMLLFKRAKWKEMQTSWASIFNPSWYARDQALALCSLGKTTPLALQNVPSQCILLPYQSNRTGTLHPVTCTSTQANKPRERKQASPSQTYYYYRHSLYMHPRKAALLTTKKRHSPSPPHLSSSHSHMNVQPRMFSQ